LKIINSIFYTISFGIRNVTHIDKALKEAHRVLKPGGKFVCLEFSNVTSDVIKKFYDFYSFKIIPLVGKFVADSPQSYEYLVESIRKFPTATAFSEMIKEAGFNCIEFRKMSFGVVAIHVGYKV
jgi:ubiquinone/menaquinone biosynthesis methyltransferase